MGRPPSIQITRNRRRDGTITYALRVRLSGSDDRVQLGNSSDGWDETSAQEARRQLLAKIELGLWTPGAATRASTEEEPTFAELATQWLADRERNPAIRARTTESDVWRLTRYLVPFFGDLRPSAITPSIIKRYRRQVHQENEHIEAAREAGKPLRDARSAQPLRSLSNDSINKTLRTLAAILDEAEDDGWISRNPARGRRTREPVPRRISDTLDADELLALLDAAAELDSQRHTAATLRLAETVRTLRDDQRLTWSRIAAQVGVAESTAHYLYACRRSPVTTTGSRRAIIATLGFAGLRVSELCALDKRDVDLAKGKIHVRDAKTPAGVRVVDIRPRLNRDLVSSPALQDDAAMSKPAYPTRKGTRRDRNNVNVRIIAPVLRRANALRAERRQPPIRAHATPHTFRRTYITIMLAAGFDLPYVQDQVGHLDPTTTLAIYAKVIRRPDRDAVRSEMRALLGETGDGTSGPPAGPAQP